MVPFIKVDASKVDLLKIRSLKDWSFDARAHFWHSSSFWVLAHFFLAQKWASKIAHSAPKRWKNSMSVKFCKNFAKLQKIWRSSSFFKIERVNSILSQNWGDGDHFLKWPVSHQKIAENRLFLKISENFKNFLKIFEKKSQGSIGGLAKSAANYVLTA